MNQFVEELEPKRVFHYFREICEIPHSSYHLDKISEYLVHFAKAHQLSYDIDQEQNVLIRKAASVGYEHAPIIILQGHMDMVCEKDADSNHNFDLDPLKLQLDQNMLSATGTTLGADDGIALAYALAILESTTIKHPPLEVLFTTNEETGMEGALGFDVSKLKGHQMINIDSEMEGVILTSSAGGVTITGSRKIAWEKNPYPCYKLTVGGLQGGHSGEKIHCNLGNANIIMGQVLKQLSNQFEFRLINIAGGDKHNAIPRECTVLLSLNPRLEQQFREQVLLIEKTIKMDKQISDSTLSVDFKPNDQDYGKVYSDYDHQAVIHMLQTIPHGVYSMSKEIPDLVQTSDNLAIVQTKEDSIIVTVSVRSSNSNELDTFTTNICQMFEQLKFKPVCSDSYPAWRYRKNSKLRELAIAVFQNQYGKKPQILAMHAGLECGIFDSKGDFDIISICSDVHDIHTPKERLDVASTARTYQFICNILKQCK